MKRAVMIVASAWAAAGLGPQARAQFYYGVSWSRGRVVRYDPGTLAGTLVASFATTAEHANAMTMDKAGRLLINNEMDGRDDLLVTFDPATNQYLPGAVQTNLSDIRSLAMSPTGVLYAATPGRLHTLNPATGAATLVGLLPGSLQGMTFAPDGTLYGVTTAALYRVDPATAAQQLIGPLLLPASGMQTVFFGPSGQLLGAFQQPFDVTNLHAISTTTGNSTPLATMGSPAGAADIRGMEFVPSPPAAALLLGGLLAGTRRRRGAPLPGR